MWIIGSKKIERILINILEELMAFKEEMEALRVQVQVNADVEQSALVLIQLIAAQLAAVANDPEAVKALAAQLKVSSDALAAAVVANTPAG